MLTFPVPSSEDLLTSPAARLWPGGRNLSLFGVIGLAIIVFIFLPASTHDAFHSPDEMAMYEASRLFGETGKLYYEDELTAIDQENLLHPRGFVTDDGRAVPYNFLGLPLLYGIAHAVIGDYSEYMGVVLGVVALAAIWGIFSTLLPGKEGWCFPLVFLATPFLYYFGRPYMNVLPMIAFMLVGIYLLLRYTRQPSTSRLAGASAFFALAILCRYPEILFITPLVLIVLWHMHGKLISRPVIRDMGIYLGVVALVFGLPLLILNQLIYGTPLTYGYELFNDAYYPNRAGTDAGGIVGKLNTAALMLLPGGLDPSMFSWQLWKNFLILAPVLTALSATGYFLLFVNRALPWKTLIALSAVAGYLMLYTGSAPVWGSQSPEPSLDHSLVRYWIMIYLALVLLAAYLISRTENLPLKLGLCATAVVTGLLGVFGSDDSLVDLRDTVVRGETRFQDEVAALTEENAVIYAGKSDKFLAGARRVAAWYNSSEGSFFEAGQVASSIARVHRLGVPAYVFHDDDLDRFALTQSLAQYGLGLEVIGLSPLSRVVPLAAEPSVGLQP